MLAVLQDKPGDPDVLYLGQVEKPTLGDNDVLIKVWGQYLKNGCGIRLKMLSVVMMSGGRGVCQPS